VLRRLGFAAESIANDRAFVLALVPATRASSNVGASLVRVLCPADTIADRLAMSLRQCRREVARMRAVVPVVAAEVRKDEVGLGVVQVIVV
jgi:hypothetical protein